MRKLKDEIWKEINNYDFNNKKNFIINTRITHLHNQTHISKNAYILTYVSACVCDCIYHMNECKNLSPEGPRLQSFPSPLD